MKDVERVNALNKMLLNANVVAYGAMVDLIKRTGRLDLDMDSGTHVDDFPAEIRVFTDIGLICLSITSVYLSGEDNLMVDGYDENNDKVDGVNVYYDQIDEVVYLVKIILEEMEGKIMGKAVKTDIEYKEILEKSLSAIQYLRIHGFSTYMESEGIVNRIMMFKDKNEMRNRRIKSIL